MAVSITQRQVLAGACVFLSRACRENRRSGNYFRMVQIRNPHGQGEWRGAGDSASSAMANIEAEAETEPRRGQTITGFGANTPARASEHLGAPQSTFRSRSCRSGVKRQLLGSDEPKDDGSFWMQWEDFVNFWKGVQAQP